MIKNIYYSKKMRAYYFLRANAFGEDMEIIKVYGGDKLKGAEIKTDKNDKKYITAIVKETLGKNGHTYFEVVQPYVKGEDISHE